MVLDHVAYHAGPVVISGTCADALALSRRDLHMIDVMAVPDRLEARVREAKYQHVLHRLFAQVVINAEELLFLDDFKELTVEGSRRRFVVAEGFFNDDPTPA